MTNLTSSNRYSDVDLAEFKAHIENKLEAAFNVIQSFEDRLESINDASGNDGDWMDDSSNAQDLDMLYSMIHRQKKHIQDLKNALIRIHNKSYGICMVTGELIDKRRLLAVPSTTKSLAAKTTHVVAEKPIIKSSKPKASSERTIISKVIKRTGGNTPTNKHEAKNFYLEEDDDNDDLGIEDLMDMENINFSEED